MFHGDALEPQLVDGRIVAKLEIAVLRIHESRSVRREVILNVNDFIRHTVPKVQPLPAIRDVPHNVIVFGHGRIRFCVEREELRVPRALRRLLVMHGLQAFDQGVVLAVEPEAGPAQTSRIDVHGGSTLNEDIILDGTIAAGARGFSTPADRASLAESRAWAYLDLVVYRRLIIRKG